MSLSPLVDPHIRGVKGKDPNTAVWCSAPGCISRAQEGHHLWSRSKLSGEPQGWVTLPSGNVIGNKTGLCRRHHADITENRSWIRLEAGDVLVWYEQAPHDTWLSRGALTTQPPLQSRDPVARDVEKVADHVHLLEGQTCELCGYTKPNRREPGPKRPVSTWNVVVPEDSEIGADVLDDWVEQFAAILGIEVPNKRRLARYHVLAVVMAWAMQNKSLFIQDIVERDRA